MRQEIDAKWGQENLGTIVTILARARAFDHALDHNQAQASRLANELAKELENAYGNGLVQARALAENLDINLDPLYSGELDFALARDRNREIISLMEQAHDLTVLLITNFPIKITGVREETAKPKPIRVLKLLGTFAWFCSRENRENIKIITADLQKDNRDMTEQKRSKNFIQCVLLWQVATAIGSIAWDGFLRLLGKTLAIFSIVQIINKLKGF